MVLPAGRFRSSGAAGRAAALRKLISLSKSPLTSRTSFAEVRRPRPWRPGCKYPPDLRRCFTSSRCGYPNGGTVRAQRPREWSEVNSRQLKLAAAGVGAGALVSMGTLSVMFSDAPGGISEGPEITLGETTTSTTGRRDRQTAIATTAATASTPESFGNGGG